MDIIEAIKTRRSVRSFDGRGMSESRIGALTRAVEESSSPFGGSVTIRLRQFDLKQSYRPTTYGMIRGAEYYFLIAMADDRQSALSTGFRFEQVVLAAVRLGLGSCWIAATFKNTDFESGQTWPNGEKLRIVCPVGVSTKPAVIERLTRMALRSDRRKPFEKLFFLNDFSRPLVSDNRFAESLEMMRLAPSSANSQPWRAVVTPSVVHFYYVSSKDISLTMIDCGIGLCHFFETERFSGHTGCFMTDKSAPEAPAGLQYLISYHPTELNQ